MSSVSRTVQTALGVEAILLLALVSLVTFSGTFVPTVLPRVNACITNQCTFLLAWGQHGSVNGQFSSPNGVAIDPLSGNVYVADGGNDRIQRFSANGTFLSAWGSAGSGRGLFSNPVGVSVDSSGLVYVTDSGNNRIQKFTNNGTFLIAWGCANANNTACSASSLTGHFNTPYGIAAASGNVYVVDSGNARIEKFASNGTSFLTMWGSSGTGIGQFNTPVGIGLDAVGNVYVADSGHNRVLKFTGNGTETGGFGCPFAYNETCLSGNGGGQFTAPKDVSIDSSGDVYVVDSFNNRVEKFYDNSTFITQWGSAGSAGGEFNNPIFLAVNQFSGNVYVTDFGNNRVEVFGYTLACAAQ